MYFYIILAYLHQDYNNYNVLSIRNIAINKIPRIKYALIYTLIQIYEILGIDI